MENEGGFKAMSQHAEALASPVPADDGRSAGISANLKSIGVDANQLTEAASEQVSELQRLLIDEVRARPLRALGWAAAVGVIFGFWAAK
jgi:ElaB/YqjD/DUF883 family membrane-anchored ribosome-binding protein